jgi:hypothetical protein
MSSCFLEKRWQAKALLHGMNDIPMLTVPAVDRAKASLRRPLRYPVTQLLGLQYLALAVFPAVIYGNTYLPFIVSVLGLALLTTGFVEWLSRAALPRGGANVIARYPKPVAVWAITLTGAVATLGSIGLGATTYATQLGLTQASPLTTLLTPLVPWLLFGCAFALASWRVGGMSRKTTLLLIGFALAVQLTAVLQIGRTASLMSFALAIGAGLVLVGFLRPRWLWVGILVAILAWPTLYSVRNATRQDVAGSQFGPLFGPDAQSRLREDLLLERAAIVGDAFSVPQPSAVDILRFGLIPRALDPNRGEISTSKALNVAMGGNSFSATTFTTLGTIWSLDGGFVGVMIYSGFVAAAFSLVYRRVTPLRIAVAVLLVYNLLWIETTFPDDVAAVLQGLVSLATAWALTAVLRGWKVNAPFIPDPLVRRAPAPLTGTGPFH